MTRRLALMAALALSAAACGPTQDWRKSPPAMPEDMRIAFPTLECLRIGEGPRLCVVELPHSPILALGVSLSVGAQHDPYELPGAAQAALTAVFEAGDEHGVSVLDTALGELGGRPHVSVEADGAFLSTTVAPDRLHEALRILMDAVMTPSVDAHAIASTRAHQCRRATELLGDPTQLAALAVRRALLPKRHPETLPALRSQICNEPLDASEAVALARGLLVPAHTTVLVAGPVTIDDVGPHFGQLTALWAPTSGASTRRLAVAPRPGAATIVHVSGLQQSVIAVGGLMPPDHPVDDPALALALAYAQSHVHDALRREFALTYGVSAELVPVGTHNLWILSAHVDATASAAALRVIRSRLAALSQESIDEDEVFTAGVQRIARTMRTFGGATSAIRLLASRHHAGVSLADTTERARDIGAIKASDLEGLVREAFDPAAAQIVAVGDPASLSEILRDARVIRPITVLDGL